MMDFLLIIKNRFRFLWKVVEKINSIVFYYFYKNSFFNISKKILHKINFGEEYIYRAIQKTDLVHLSEFLISQDQEQLTYFNPHDFDLKTLKHYLKNSSFLMFGVFNKEQLIGYFFLRCFINRICFQGRIVTKSYQGKGIAKKMAQILYRITWDVEFKLYSTISQSNFASLNSHKANINFRVVKNLKNNYLLIEFLEHDKKNI